MYYKTTLCPVWFSEVITRGDKFQVTKCSLKRCVLRGKRLSLDFNSDQHIRVRQVSLRFRPCSPLEFQQLSGQSVRTRTRRVVCSILIWSSENFSELSGVEFSFFFNTGQLKEQAFTIIYTMQGIRMNGLKNYMHSFL